MRFKTTVLFLILAALDSSAEQTGEKVRLGRELFFDTRLSSTQTVSCNSCHNISNSGAGALSGTDNRSFSVGVFGALGGRNAPTVWNVGLRKTFFWDGRAATLEQQASGPILNPAEMGMKSVADVEKTIRTIPEYSEKFRKAFNHEKNAKPYSPSMNEIVQALAEFEKTLTTPDSPFERFRNGETQAISEAAQRGWTKFRQTGCIACHAAPTFSGEDYFVRFPLHELKEENIKFNFTEDKGRYGVTGIYKDRNLWRIPSLQNVALTAPYFHNGAVDSLEEAVRIMAKAQLSKTLPAQDIKDIVEFLKSLTGVNRDNLAPAK